MSEGIIQEIEGLFNDDEEEEEVCDPCEWEVDRVTEWSMMGTNIVHVVVQIYCPKCETYGNTDCSWEFSDSDVRE
mgnify:CR=1 FL=1